MRWGHAAAAHVRSPPHTPLVPSGAGGGTAGRWGALCPRSLQRAALTSTSGQGHCPQELTTGLRSKVDKLLTSTALRRPHILSTEKSYSRGARKRGREDVRQRPGRVNQLRLRTCSQARSPVTTQECTRCGTRPPEL